MKQKRKSHHSKQIISAYKARLMINLDLALKKEEKRINIFRDFFTEQQVNQHIRKLADLVIYSKDKPKIIKDISNKEIQVGFYMWADKLIQMKTNDYAKIFNKSSEDEENRIEYPHFTRLENSTFHRNSSIKGYNGYTHWYKFPVYILEAIIETDRFMQFNISDYDGKIFSTKCAKLYSEDISIEEASARVKADEWFVIQENTYNALLEAANNTASELRIDILRKMKTKAYFDTIHRITSNTMCKIGSYYFVNNIIESNKTIDNGRVYTVLGTMHKVIRKTILKGYTEIDVSSSVQSILLNSVLQIKTKEDQAKIKKEFPELYDIVYNKDLVREKIAKLFKCSISEAKTILLSLMFAPKNRHIWCMYNRKIKTLIQDRIILEQLSPKRKYDIKKEMYKIRKDTNKLRCMVIQKYYYCNKEYKDKIDTLLGITPETKLTEKLLKGITFRIYEMLECTVRNIMKEYVQDSGVKFIHQVHDCIMFKDNQNVNMNDLTEILFEKGFTIKLNKEIF